MKFGEYKKIMLSIPPEYDDYDVEMFDKENDWMNDCDEIGVNTERKSIVIR